MRTIIQDIALAYGGFVLIAYGYGIRQWRLRVRRDRSAGQPHSDN